jgi:hypothetical protein
MEHDTHPLIRHFCSRYHDSNSMLYLRKMIGRLFGNLGRVRLGNDTDCSVKKSHLVQSLSVDDSRSPFFAGKGADPAILTNCKRSFWRPIDRHSKFGKYWICLVIRPLLLVRHDTVTSSCPRIFIRSATAYVPLHDR